MRKLTLFLLASLLCNMLWAAKIDTLKIKSESLKEVNTMVVVPDIASKKACPVIYLLHGYLGDETSWLGIKPNLPEIADEKGLIFVSPDGQNNWYLNSPMDKTSQYETFISVELVNYIDQHYNTLKDRKFRAITGLSMGGHGALYNAFRHKDVFGAVGSMSGVTNVHFGLENLELGKFLGKDNENWVNASVMNQIDKIKNGELAIYVDCGVNDFLFEDNKQFNAALWEKGIDHEFTIRQGVHDGDYWNNSIDYHILFFCKYFGIVK